ncbi:snRNA-activating protein complex subunit 3 [Belonocnema kinseyi]|uniref:snRNA-activating protein complex subunit 3 n=1 Tax=Belonocnema kinseyi TaxID=2817044 RepID=UPI00143DFBA8|nr:snRNA-activating protein complex subunit 3 [Belonocnema kinseyi]
MSQPSVFYEQLYHASPKVNLSTYFTNYATLKEQFYTVDTPKVQRSVSDSMGANIEEEDFNMLKEYCSIDNLTIANEVIEYGHMKSWSKELLEASTIPDVPLKTLTELQKSTIGMKPMKRSTKYRSEICVKHEEDPSRLVSAVPGKDFLVYIRIYAPFKHRVYNKTTAQLIKVSLSNVVSILGSQTLADLRDKISCISDLSITTDVSEKPVLKPGPSAKEIYNSAFFFIEGIFYNDMRDPENKDNSQVIREWASARKIGSFQTACMEDTKIDSLNLRFGFPWVYQHQGNCEHLIVFSDARLLNCNDHLSVTSYPRIERIKPYINKYCMTCGMFSVRWITTNNDRLPHDPCFFCEKCFKSYNYVNGEKIGTFSAYPYPFHAELMQKFKNNESNDQQ